MNGAENLESGKLAHNGGYICECGFRTVGKSNALPRYCSRCSQLLKVGGLAGKGKLHVLLVDDSKLIRRVVGSLLRQMGCTVSMAEDGETALAMAEGSVPDLVLTDLVMDGMDGTELIKALRSNKELAQIPVAVLTSKGDAHTVASVMELRVIAYILKDYMDGDRFKRSIESCINAATRYVASQVKRYVVVAEDNHLLRDVLAHMLEEMGCEVGAAGDGETALELMGRQRPDLLITDMAMPRKNGLELVRAVRDEADLHGIPVVMLTGKGDSETMTKALELGVQAYLVKGATSPKELRGQLAQFLTAAPSVASPE